MHAFRTALAAFALFAAGAMLQALHPLALPASYHHFADSRALGGFPNVANVASNLAISAAGVVALLWSFRRRGAAELLLPGIVVAGMGLVLTGGGSAWYHYHPTDATLVWDRVPLAIVFGGVLVTLWSSATLVRPTFAQVGIAVLAAIATVICWAKLGNLWPYALLQYGGLATILYLVLTNRVLGTGGWWRVIQWYALAKVFEIYDEEVFRLTGHLVSGHTLKHLASAAAGLALLRLAQSSHYAYAKKSIR